MGGHEGFIIPPQEGLDKSVSGGKYFHHEMLDQLPWVGSNLHAMGGSTTAWCD